MAEQTMVERVARAMLLAEHPLAGVKVWEVDPEAGRIWLARARAAIEAMREEPTPEMGLAMYAAWDAFGEDAAMGPREAIAIWKAGIDAGLKS